jgi:hypothetical protein
VCARRGIKVEKSKAASKPPTFKLRIGPPTHARL